MKNYIYSFLLASSLAYSADCCTAFDSSTVEGSLLSSSSNGENHYVSDSGNCNMDLARDTYNLTPNECVSQGVKLVNTSVTPYTNKVFASAGGYVLADSGNYCIASFEMVQEVQETYSCISSAPQCEDNETIVNGECVPVSPQNCQSLHSDDWLINGATDASSCGALVDGLAYSQASFHDSYSGYSSACCVLPVKPAYDCSELGETYYARSASDELECDSYLGDDVTGTSWLTGSNNAPTCCVNVPNLDTETPTDNNGTDTETPTDNNGTDTETPTDNTGDIADAVTNEGNKTQEAIKSLSSSNESGLNRIGDAIDGLRTDMNTTIGDLANEVGELADSLDSNVSNDIDLDLASVLDNGISGITERFSTIVNYNLGVAPAFVSDSSGCSFNLDITYGSFPVPLGEILDQIRPYLNGLWAFLFIYISFLMYYRGFLIIINLL